MSEIKRRRALDVAASLHVHTGPVTAGHILALVGDELQESLTGRQLGQVMAAVNRGYQAGEATPTGETPRRTHATRHLQVRHRDAPVRRATYT